MLRACVRQNRFKPVQTGSNRFKPVQTGGNPRKKCTVSSSGRLYKPSRYCNCHHNPSSISTEHFDSTLQSTSRCRDGSKFCKYILYIIFVCITIVLRSLPIYFVASLATMKYTCSKCNKVFARNYHLLRQIRTACNSTTTVSPPSICSKCGKVFGKKAPFTKA